MKKEEKPSFRQLLFKLQFAQANFSQKLMKYSKEVSAKKAEDAKQYNLNPLQTYYAFYQSAQDYLKEFRSKLTHIHNLIGSSEKPNLLFSATEDDTSWDEPMNMFHKILKEVSYQSSIALEQITRENLKMKETNKMQASTIGMLKVTDIKKRCEIETLQIKVCNQKDQIKGYRNKIDCYVEKSKDYDYEEQNRESEDAEMLLAKIDNQRNQLNGFKNKIECYDKEFRKMDQRGAYQQNELIRLQKKIDCYDVEFRKMDRKESNHRDQIIGLQKKINRIQNGGHSDNKIR